MAKYKDKWKTAKQTFKTITKVPKPSLKFLGAFDKGNNIEGALGKVDEVMAKDKGPGTINAAWLRELGLAYDTFVKAKDAYMKLLDTAARAEVPGHDRDQYLKGVAVLQTELTAAQKEIKTVLAHAQQMLTTDQNAANLAELERKKLVSNIKSDVARAAAESAKVKAAPTAANFNTHIMPVAQFMYNRLQHLQVPAGFRGGQSPKQVAENVLAPSINKLPDNATPQQVEHALEQFHAAAQKVQQWALTPTIGRRQ